VLKTITEHDSLLSPYREIMKFSGKRNSAMQASSSPGSRQKGFTLIELLVTLVIIGILAGIALVAMVQALDKAKQRATMADMRTIARAIEAYQIDVGRIPGDAGGLAALTPFLIPYQINVVPLDDHWSNALVYTSDTSSYSIESFGKDGVDGANISLATKVNFNLDIIISDGVFIASPE
jgi:general secretion pathway protein G